MGKNTNIVFFFFFLWCWLVCVVGFLLLFFCSGAILKLFGFVKHNLTDYNYQYSLLKLSFQ